jgi:hypothetical protein
MPKKSVPDEAPQAPDEAPHPDESQSLVGSGQTQVVVTANVNTLGLRAGETATLTHSDELSAAAAAGYVTLL